MNMYSLTPSNPLNFEDTNISLDRAHGGLPEHVDMTVKLPEYGMADQIRVDCQTGDVLGGTTHVGGDEIHW